MTLPLSWSLGPVEPQRVLRAVAQYRVRRAVDLGRRVYIIDGGSEPHVVNLGESDVPLCECGHHTFSDVVCVHAVAAMLFEGDTRMTALLGEAMREAWLDQPPPIPSKRPQYRNGVRVA